jgi:hypothetical protein
MMKQIWRGIVAILGLLVVGAGSGAYAQMPGPYQPPINPYINILRGGAPPAINYFNIVQPQLEFNAAISQLQMQQNIQGQAIAAGNTLGTTTGHPVMFGNYSHYYTRQGMGAGLMGGSGMGYGSTGGMGGMGTGGMGSMGMGGMGMGGMGMGGMGMGGMGMGGMGMGGMGMGGMGMGGMGIPR